MGGAGAEAFTFFAPQREEPGIAYRVERVEADDGTVGYRATGSGERAQTVVEFLQDGEALHVTLAMANPQGAGGKALPLCAVELRIEDIDVGAGAIFYQRPCVWRTHARGRAVGNIGQPWRAVRPWLYRAGAAAGLPV